MKMLKNYKKGFTLIELLVVIAIIGILSSIVMASLNSARAKSRDAKRLSDIKSLQLALELYFDHNKAYPGGGYESLKASLVDDEFISALPKDPLPSDWTGYKYCSSGDGYNLAAKLEQDNKTALDSDADKNVTSCSSGDNFNGTDALVYDVTD